MKRRLWHIKNVALLFWPQEDELQRQADAFNLAELQAAGTLKRALSREAAGDHFHGRITGLLGQVPLAADSHYYLCGLDTMINETNRWLEAHGIAYPQIHREIFFYENEPH